MRRGRWSEIPAAAGLALASKTSPGRRVSKAFPQGFPLWQFQVALLPLGYPASVIKKIRRTIERRLIRTFHLVERSIPKFRIGCLSPTGDSERPTSSRCASRYPVRPLLTERVRRWSAPGPANGPAGQRLEARKTLRRCAYRGAP